jgi:hypothetical protein
MPHRLIGLWVIVLGVVGLALAGVLVLWGKDLHAAARSGPAWKRKLLVATISLLSAAGVYSGASAAGAAGAPAPAATQPQPIQQTPQWQKLSATWQAADDAASGRKGPYPFDRKDKENLLAALIQAGLDVEAFVAAGRLEAVEGELLKRELARLRAGVDAMRPTEMRNATCYGPTMVAPVHDAVLRLADRTPLLEKLAAAGTIHPAAVDRTLTAIEADLTTVTKSAEAWRKMVVPGNKTGEQAAKAALAAVLRVRARLAAASAPASAPAAGATAAPAPAGGAAAAAAAPDGPRWQTIVDAWRFAKPLADSHKSTTAQRKVAADKLAAATKAAAELAAAGEIAPAESALLAAEAQSLQADILRDPPTDSAVKCYDMFILPPAQRSVERLQKRLPLLKALVAAGKVAPAVAERVLPTIRADLATLSDAKELARLQPAPRQQAAGVLTESTAALAGVEGLLPKPTSAPAARD